MIQLSYSELIKSMGMEGQTKSIIFQKIDISIRYPSIQYYKIIKELIDFCLPLCKDFQNCFILSAVYSLNQSLKIQSLRLFLVWQCFLFYPSDNYSKPSLQFDLLKYQPILFIMHYTNHNSYSSIPNYQQCFQPLQRRDLHLCMEVPQMNILEKRSHHNQLTLILSNSKKLYQKDYQNKFQNNLEFVAIIQKIPEESQKFDSIFRQLKILFGLHNVQSMESLPKFYFQLELRQYSEYTDFHRGIQTLDQYQELSL